ncbi:MAG: HEPN domain-containing protein [Ardenticatenaceae bacterium]|nr:HEPN domain-containing protein [Ardenticatenaceae bacterium]
MPLDPVLVADTQGWLQKAANDLRGAEIDPAATPPLLEDAVFHCQQAAEKALKAFLTFHNQPFRRRTIWKKSAKPAWPSTRRWNWLWMRRCR